MLINLGGLLDILALIIHLEKQIMIVSQLTLWEVITQKTISETYNEIDRRVNDIDSILSNNINAEGKYLLPDSKVDKLQEELDRHKREEI